MARSMLSFGIAASRAFSIAFWSARFPAGSGPPSRAATMIARTSLEKSWPRFASVAPFLRLMDAHLLCPDKARLPDGVEKELVHARVVGQFWMEGSDQEASLPEQHRLADELLWLPHLDRIRTEASQHRRVLAEISLYGQDADLHDANSRFWATEARRRGSHRGAGARETARSR